MSGGGIRFGVKVSTESIYDDITRSGYPSLYYQDRARDFVWPDAPPPNINSERADGLAGILFGDGTRDGWGLAQLLGWHCLHIRDSRGMGFEGFPDWVCIRETVAYIELKRQRDELRPLQVDMARRLIGANQHYYIVRPCDWDTIGQVLIHGPK